MIALGISVLLAILTSAPEGVDNEGIDFVGFSDDEVYAAWRIHEVRRDADKGIVDRYELIRVVATKTGTQCGLYRASPVVRTLWGTQIQASRRKLLADNPSYAKARPARRWATFSTHHSFSAAPLDGRSDIVQIVASPEVLVDTDATTLHLRSAAGTGRFEIRGQLVSGQRISLARGSLHGSSELNLYRSYTGYHAAVVQRSAEGIKGGETRVWTVRIRDLPLADSPRRDDPRSGQVAMMLFRDAQGSRSSWGGAEW